MVWRKKYPFCTHFELISIAMGRTGGIMAFILCLAEAVKSKIQDGSVGTASVCWCIAGVAAWTAFQASTFYIIWSAKRREEEKQTGASPWPVARSLKEKLLALVDARDGALGEIAESNEPEEVKEEKMRAILEQYRRDTEAA